MLTTEPDKPTNEPDTPAKETDTPTTEPDTPTTETDTPTTEPDTPTTEPDTPTTEPDIPTMMIVKTHEALLPLLSVAVYVMRVTPGAKLCGDTRFAGDFTTVGFALASCSSALSLTCGSDHVTWRVGLSGSVPSDTSGGHVIVGGLVSKREVIKS